MADHLTRGNYIMTTHTQKKETNDVQHCSSSMLALAVLTERIRSLPAEDKNDLYELSKAFFTAECEEDRNSAQLAMQEILEQEPSSLVPVQTADEPGQELETWTDYIGKLIREKRLAAGLTQEQLEQKSGLPQSHISRLENALHSPSFATLQRIADALSIPVSDLDPCII